MTKTTQRKLGIIAGGGTLPATLVEFCRQTNLPFFVLALKNHAQPQLLPTNCDIAWIRIGSIGKAIKLLKQNNVTDIVMIGHVRRPSVMELLPDAKGLQLLARIGLNKKGDDGLLRDVIREIETLGFHVKGIHEFLPNLLAPLGTLTKCEPSGTDKNDIERGFFVAQLLGLADVGQSVAVQNGLVLSVEGIEGTKALIERTKTLKRKGNGGVLVKTIKPMQDIRVDMPTIGPETIQSVYDAKLKGIAIEAGKVLITNIEQVVKTADKLGIFVIGVQSCDLIDPTIREQINQFSIHINQTTQKSKGSHE
ncbi:MAG: UDP-2,3-diacylglucosamine diphosphatase LpxI [Alphaproteobacteria bacterium]|nr:UDP-2,3-diacylglucosamine diphosphatase LpxI [Alphaproteobacteria bacterium]